MDSDVVELSVEAVSGRIAVVRNLVEAVLLAEDFGLDTIADVKIGVDEACTQLVAAAPPRARLRLHLTTGAEYARVTVCCDIDGDDLDQTGFGWYVITSVADDADIAYLDGTHGREARITMTAHRD
ncbi:hypothetical protein HUN08_14855 [Gordonia sp. X0973]|uniref:hypothetical protein n=1 Tax=Gordonia sp. X0973 TaxID=2742602 RepID=UPI000F539001|nr:hypothetical protein [Gordonia sp. X0973]QKT08335.1 hypothetical protein HUN08_14855 [Gordonia sp. X0973]